MVDLKEQLLSISASLDYIDIYLNFVSNRKLTKQIIHKTENHHILPKQAFPEYENLKIHTWNKAILKYEDHVYAHYLLTLIHKRFDQSFAYMCDCAFKKQFEFLEFQDEITKAYSVVASNRRKISSDLHKGKCVYVNTSDQSDRRKLDPNDQLVLSGQFQHINSGYAIYVDSSGKKFRLKPSDTAIEALGLKSFSSSRGSIFTASTKAQMSEKAKNRSVFKCIKCQSLVTGSSGIAHHNIKHLCNDQFVPASESEIAAHKIIIQQNKDSKLEQQKRNLDIKRDMFRCLVCGKYAAYLSNIKQHMKIHPALDTQYEYAGKISKADIIKLTGG